MPRRAATPAAPTAAPPAAPPAASSAVPSGRPAADAFTPWEQALRVAIFTDRPPLSLSVPDQLAAELARRILAGSLEPGLRLGEQELAAEFQVSRGPVREALRVLEREGLVTLNPRRGAMVTELSAREVAELFEIRAALFSLVVQKVIRAPQPELMAALHAGVSRLESLADADGGDAYAETVYRLLVLAARHAGNQRLEQMLSALSLQTLRYSKLGLASVARRRRSARQWRQAIRAIERGDEAQAVALTLQRIRESGEEAARRLVPG
jgi:DNA-binding GntR family transcriptional regulator